MLMALLKGKLSREQENMEDILTSNIFGLLKYLPPSTALLPFLRGARTVDGDGPLADLGDGTTVDYSFWPLWRTRDGRYCEPDVVVRLKPPGMTELLVLIEAKFYSGKSSQAEPDQPDDETHELSRDQLEKEWECLRREAGDATPVLVYLTSHLGLPHADIEASIAAVRSSSGELPTIAWLSWRHLTDLLRDAQDPIFQDLHASLLRLGLSLFRGVPPMPPRRIVWRFTIPFDWMMKAATSVGWQFRPRRE